MKLTKQITAVAIVVLIAFLSAVELDKYLYLQKSTKQQLRDSISKLNAKIDSLENPILNIDVRVTDYQLDPKQTKKGKYWENAWQEDLRPYQYLGNTIALSRDLMDKHVKKDQKVFVECIDNMKYTRVYTVRDKMHYRFEKSIDILTNETVDCNCKIIKIVK